MRDFESYLHRAMEVWARIAGFARTRRARYIAIGIVSALLIYGIAGAVAVPRIVHQLLVRDVSAAIKRRITTGRVHFNPYTLRLRIERIGIAEQNGGRFAEIALLDVNASWSSLFRMAPIVSELTILRPRIDVTRNADGSFNFSDLLAPGPSPAQPSPTPKFSVSNIRVIDGTLAFDDRANGERHEIDRLELGIPFISDLPGTEDIVVQPLLQMQVDGRPVRIAGVSKPFGGSLESAINLHFIRVELPRYARYLPQSVALKVPSGVLSVDLLVRFRQTESAPSIVINGSISVDGLDLRDSSDAAFLSLDHGEAKMADVEPLEGVANLSEVAIAGLKANLVRNQDGSTNIAAIMRAAPQETPPSSPSPPKPQAVASPSAAAAATPHLDAGVESIKVTGSSIKLKDLSAPREASVDVEGIDASVENLRLNGQVPASFRFAAVLRSGGTLGAKGSFDMAGPDFAADVALDGVALPALQGFAQDVFAGAIDSGKLSAHGAIRGRVSGSQFDLHAEPADVAVDEFALQAPPRRKSPVAWKHFGISIADFDLAQRIVDVAEVRASGIKLMVRRERNGRVSLAALMKPQARWQEAGGHGGKAPNPNLHAPAAAVSPSPQPQWRYKVGSVAIEDTEARLEDRAEGRRVNAGFAPLNIHAKGISSDLSKPVEFEVDGVRDGSGTFKVQGTAAIDPLNADLHVDTTGLQVAEAADYVIAPLNADLSSASLTTSADLSLAQSPDGFRVRYRGDATVGNLAASDKLTGDDFLNWRSLHVSDIDVDVGATPSFVRVGGVALSTFYARVILDSSGKLNLNDILGSPSRPPKSLTRELAAEAETPAPAPTPSPAAPPHPNTDITVGKVTLDEGHVDYTDDFIKPHYSANLTDIGGSVGEFGTATQVAAPVELRGRVNGSAPLLISGTINPLAPMAFVDLRAKAEGIELTGLSPYSTKYTGYPIVKGTLTANVHYLLNQGELRAENHIFLDQLTFGDRVESATATNLPVRFAVAVLKNSRGEIDLDVPVSGSLSDPQFRIGAVIWNAFANLITKAISSPFSLLASAVGGIAGGGGGDLSYVAFDPGRATLTPEAKKELATLGNALVDRPALRLSISGRVDTKVDMDGMREAWVADQIRAQKTRDTGAIEDSDAHLSPADYDKYLARAYYKAKFPKPRDFIGMAKKLPPDQMKKLMLTNAPVSEADLRKLADARANAVRQYLSVTVAPSRLFISEPKLDAEGIKEGPATRADLSLQ